MPYMIWHIILKQVSKAVCQTIISVRHNLLYNMLFNKRVITVRNIEKHHIFIEQEIPFLQYPHLYANTISSYRVILTYLDRTCRTHLYRCLQHEVCCVVFPWNYIEILMLHLCFNVIWNISILIYRVIGKSTYSR